VTLDVRPFEDSDVEAAGRLLATHHTEHRRHEPRLDARFAGEAAASAEVSATWSGEGVSGAVALEDGRHVGYLLGAPKNDPTWGANVWIEAAGVAVQDADTARDLYAVAAARWVDEGRLAHYALVPSNDVALIDAFFRLGFGLQHVHAIREPLAGFADPTVRRARHDDAPVVARLDLELLAHQARSPVFSSRLTGTYEEALAEAEESIGDPEYAIFVVEREGRVVGASLGCALTKSGAHAGLARPDDAGFLGFAAVLPGARGTGAGRAVGDAVLAWSAEAGYRSVVTDWRATNLLSSRFWPRLGFRPTFLRLHRLIGH
jgi:ribosomal protein S18 acetylase RimI-like enzyme